MNAGEKAEFDRSKRIVAERQGWHCFHCGVNTHGDVWPGHSTHHRQSAVSTTTSPRTWSDCADPARRAAMGGRTSIRRRPNGSATSCRAGRIRAPCRSATGVATGGGSWMTGLPDV